jgi:23S rRNA pseudouridine1911/1915/1917 synthase
MTLAATPTLAAVVRDRMGISWSRAKALCLDGRVTVDGERERDPAARVRPGADIVVDAHAPKSKPEASSGPAIVHMDRDLVVVDKPPGLLSVGDRDEDKETLLAYVRRQVGNAAVVQRLDRDTSGLMVFARTPSAQRALAALFKAHDIERTYHAIVHGAPLAERIESQLLPDRGDGLRGSFGLYRHATGEPPATARRAVTFVEPVEALRGATLVACRLETGRQHQIRIHLAERGHPLLGERVYDRDYAGPRIAATRTMLHARTLGFVHPGTGRTLRFEREAPADFASALEALRA